MFFKVRFIIFFIGFFFCFVTQLDSQSRRIERGDHAFEQRHYLEAIEHYDRAYDRARRRDREEAARITYNTAVSYTKINEPRRAEMWFRRALRLGYSEPEIYLRYANTLLRNEKYEDALEQYEKYIELKPEDPRGKVGVKSVQLTQELIDNPTQYRVEEMRIFNSRDGADFTPTYGDHRESSVIFASARDETLNNRKDPWTGEYYTDLFISYQNRQGEWSNPVLLDEGPVNTEFNEGTPNLNSNKTELYLTRCVTEEGANLGCRIYRSKREGKRWGQPQKLDFVNDSSISVGHPAISPDELKLYFVSDMPGGVGGKDIWVVSRNNVNEEFKNPVNLGPVINTKGNEMFPYVRYDGVLLFSSDGHPGMGGLDIFKTKKEGDSWSVPKNLGYPINSPGDDYGIVFKTGEEKGFLSSNRAGRRGDMIYSFIIPPLEFSLKGIVRDDNTKFPLPNATVQLIGSDGTIEVSETNEEGEYYFDETMIKPEQIYEMLVSKDDYFSTRGQETTEGIQRSREFVHDFYLEPIPEEPIELPEILYDFASWELRPQFKDSLSGLVRTLEDNPNIVIELASHTDSRGTHEQNDTLSQKRAQSVVDFLIDSGINPDRLKAKGYGKRKPREINETMTREGVTFEAGTVINEEFIRSLETQEQREVAHQLNRRTEFRVIGDDFKTDDKRKSPSERRRLRR